MSRLPLLSDLETPALLTASEPRPDSEPEAAVVLPSPGPSDPEFEDDATGDDDMETARTRPLRFDRLHL